MAFAAMALLHPQTFTLKLSSAIPIQAAGWPCSDRSNPQSLNQAKHDKHARTDVLTGGRLTSLSRAAEVGPGFLPEESIFLAVTCGDVVIVQESEGPAAENWWMGAIIHIVFGARSLEPSLFQVACIDTGVIKTVNADQVTKVVRSVSSQHQQNACISEK